MTEKEFDQIRHSYYRRNTKQQEITESSGYFSYFKIRCLICLIIFLVDIRHDPTSNDFLMYDYVIRSGLPCMILTNKADKIAKTKVDDASKNIQKQLNPIGDITTLPFSSERKVYSDEVWKIIEEHIKEEVIS